MTGTALATASAWSYGIAAAAFLLLTIRMALGLRRSRHGPLLFSAVAVTALWAAAGSAFGLTGRLDALAANTIADTLRYACWFAFIASLLTGSNEAGSARTLPRWSILLAAVFLIGTLTLSSVKLFAVLPELDRRFEYVLRVGIAILGLVYVEQLYRVAHPQARWGIKPLTLALGAMFGYDLFLFADALLFSRLDPDIWTARGAANALLVPFFVIATARNKDWTIEMHLSRNAVFHSTALLVSGAFLLAVAGAGYIVRFLGGEWGRALQIELLFAAAVLITLVATSGRFRSRLKVFLSKHFFSYRYDYREEWLRFTRTLSTESPVHGTHERAIMSLADLVESPGGALWLADERNAFVPATRLNMARVESVLAPGSSLVNFLERTGWVIVASEVVDHPSRYPDLTLPEWISGLPNGWLIVPLSTGVQLIGFVVLLIPRTPIEVDWEVRDLLKAAARAAAAYLQQIRVTEALLESRKFDAFNRMSAFVVHDLKNLVAQLTLLLRNAERHQGNPEFQRDMLGTVDHVVSRMNRLMLQLRTGTTPVENARPVELGPIVRRVCKAKAASPGAIQLELTEGVHALGHEDRLEHVIGHLVQNALDATINGGTVSVGVGMDDRYACIVVTDTGVGMTAEFQRDRLFKPFETTKTSGMGIGVYESQQYVAGVGGRMSIESEEANGTRVRVMLPNADGTTVPTVTVKEAA